MNGDEDTSCGNRAGLGASQTRSRNPPPQEPHRVRPPSLPPLGTATHIDWLLWIQATEVPLG